MDTCFKYTCGFKNMNKSLQSDMYRLKSIQNPSYNDIKKSTVDLDVKSKLIHMKLSQFGNFVSQQIACTSSNNCQSSNNWYSTNRSCSSLRIPITETPRGSFPRQAMTTDTPQLGLQTSLESTID